MTDSNRHACILGVLHQYQLDVFRKEYLDLVEFLISWHKVDLVAEEASGPPTTIAKQWVAKCKHASLRDIEWENVDLTGAERKFVPDANPTGVGTLVDLDLQITREWVWVVRTSKKMKTSALLICGWAHVLSVAEKFRHVGFTVETHLYFAKEDADKIV